MEAIVLAGGMGKRLRPFTQDVPKPMIDINGRPLMDYTISWLKRSGITKIVLACGYKWEKIKEHYGTQFIYSVEKEPLGTGGAIKKALKHIDDDEFFLVNVDDVTNVDFRRLKKMGSNTIAIARFHSQFGIVETKDGKVVSFKQKPLLPYWAWCGVALLNKKIPLPDNGAIEKTTFPKIELNAMKHPGFWMTINTVKEKEEFEDATQKLDFLKRGSVSATEFKRKR